MDADVPAIPPSATPAAQPLLDALAQAGNAGRHQVAESALTATASIGAEASEHAQALRADAAEQAQAIHGAAEQTRRRVDTVAAASQANVRESAQGPSGQLVAWRQRSEAAAQQHVVAAAQQARAHAAEQATRSTTAGQHATTEVSGAMTGAAAEAAQGTGGAGSGDAAEARIEVDRTVSQDTTRQLRTAAADAGTAIRAQSREAAQTVGASGERAASVLAQEAGPLTDRISSTTTTAMATVTSGATQVNSRVRVAASAAAWDLSTTADAGARALHIRSDEAQGAAAAAAAAAVRATTAQASEALRESRAAESQAAQQIAAADLDERTATEVAGQLPGHLEAAHQPMSTALEAAGTHAGGTLADAGHQVRAGLGEVGTTVAGTLRDGADQFAGQAAAAVQSASQALAGAARAATEAGDALVQATSRTLTSAADQVGTALGAASAAVEAHAAERSADAAVRSQGAIAGMRTRVREGQSRVDAQMGRGPAVQRGILSDIGDWVSDQLKDLWNMLRSPSFWVGLIVTILLFPALGPGALVVGGIVGGAVSGIENNVHSNRPWYSPGPIIQGAAIGGLAGAALAFGAGVIVGAGLEGVAALGATMALSALIGVGTNVATGERWDRALLANLFLAWLFHRVGGRTRTPGEGAPPVEPAATRVNTKVPGLYEAINPNEPPPGGWRFVDDIQEFGNIREIETAVTSPDGHTGRMMRSVETDTGRLSMEQAFLDQIPDGTRWVQTEPPMVEGRGTPLEAYMTMRQMRIMEGRGASFTGPRTVHISTIVNTKTCLQLAAAEAAGTPRNVAILETHSVQYANNSIVQSGGRVTGATVTDASAQPASTLRGVTPEQLATYGIRPDQQVPFGFSVDLTVVPADAPASAPGPATSPRHALPVPVPPGNDDR